MDDKGLGDIGGYTNLIEQRTCEFLGHVKYGVRRQCQMWCTVRQYLDNVIPCRVACMAVYITV